MAKNKHIELDESKPKKLFIDRSSNYAKNCTFGYMLANHNAHHLVPCTSIQHSLKTFVNLEEHKEPMAYNKALSWFTDWDVNQGYNLIGLPHQRAYELAYGKKGRKQAAAAAPKWMTFNLTADGTDSDTYVLEGVIFPIHLSTSWGHVAYNAAVEKQLDNIWDRLSVEFKKHEPVKASDMGSLIKGVGNTFKGRLQAKCNQTKELWRTDIKSSEFMMFE